MNKEAGKREADIMMNTKDGKKAKRSWADFKKRMKDEMS